MERKSLCWKDIIFNRASEYDRNSIPSHCRLKKSFIPVNLRERDNGGNEICRDISFGFIMINYL
jgi:hypothetical protein